MLGLDEALSVEEVDDLILEDGRFVARRKI